MTIGFAVSGASLVSLCRDLENLGCDALWLPGHISTGRPVPEAMVGLAMAAAATDRVRVGTSVLLLPLYPPLLAAKQLAEIDRMSGGRISVGVGVGGEYPQEFDGMGVDVRDRGPRTDEALEILRTLWAGGPVTRPSTRWPLNGVDVTPGPLQRGGPPIIVAGRKAPAMRRAARFGDGWMPFLFTPRLYAESVAVIRTEAAASGRSLDGFGWHAFIYVCVDDDPASARAKALRFVGAGQAGDPSRFDAVIDKLSATGTPEQVAARLQSYLDAGADDVIVALTTTGPAETVAMASRVIREVVPLLRSPAPAPRSPLDVSRTRGLHAHR